MRIIISKSKSKIDLLLFKYRESDEKNIKMENHLKLVSLCFFVRFPEINDDDCKSDCKMPLILNGHYVFVAKNGSRLYERQLVNTEKYSFH